MRNASRICPILLVMFLSTLVSFKSFAMPPHSDLEDRMRGGEVPVPKHLLNPRFLQESGINQPSLHSVSEVYPTGTGPVGTYKALVLLVEFSDNSSSVNASFFDTLVFENQFGCVRHYYQEVSYGTLDIVTVDLPSAVGWNTAPETYAYYVDGQHGFGSYPRNAQKLVEDLVDLVDPVVDFSEYDNDSDGYVDALIVVHAGQGAELTGNPNHIWSHKWGVTWGWSVSNLKDGVRVWEYTMQPEYWLSPYDMTCGVYCHELGHVFGLPDLYDTDYSSYGIGKWSLMAYGSWNGYLGDSPAHPDAWCMTRLGYVSATVVVSNTIGVEIPAIQDFPVAYKLWTSGAPMNEYFLVANRQRTGYDSALPYHGLLIWHVDENISDYGANDDEWYPGHTSFGHYKVALEQADGLWELEQTAPFGYVNYSGDPYPGSSNNRTFDGSSVPNSQSYAETETYVAVVNISDSGDTMTCDLLVSPPSADFTIEAKPETLTVSPGDSINCDVILESLNGFSSSCTLTVEEDSLPANTTYGFNSATIVPTDTSILTFHTDASTPPDTSIIIVTGSEMSGEKKGIEHSTQVVLIVLQPDFTIEAKPETLTVAAGDSINCDVILESLNGFSSSCTLTVEEDSLPSNTTYGFNSATIVPTDTSILTFHTDASTPPDTSIIIVTGSEMSGEKNGIEHSTQVVLIVLQPDFTIEAEPETLTVAAGDSINCDVILESLNGFSSSCTLTVVEDSLSANTTYDFNPVTLMPTDTSILTFHTDASTPPGTSIIIVTGSEMSGEKNGIEHSTQVVLVVLQPDFTIEAEPETLTVNPGDSINCDVILESLNGFSSSCTLTVVEDSLSANTTYDFNPVTLMPTDTSILTFHTDASTPPGTSIIIVTGSEISGGKERSTQVVLIIPWPQFTDEDQADDLLPHSYLLKQNYPNPFNPQTKIEYSVPRDGHVKLEIFNLLGQKIQTLVDTKQKRGTYTVTWDGIDEQGASVSSGIYFYQLSADNFEESSKMILLK